MFVSCRVSEPKPTCGVTTSRPIQGQNVQLSCSMTYRRLTENRQSIPAAYFSALISWDSAAGTPPGRMSRTPVYNSNGMAIGESLQVDVTTLASGAEIPSYNCTSSFHFTGTRSENFAFAVNSVSWTCVSEPVITWCMYFICSHYIKLLSN